MKKFDINLITFENICRKYYKAVLKIFFKKIEGIQYKV